MPNENEKILEAEHKTDRATYPIDVRGYIPRDVALFIMFTGVLQFSKLECLDYREAGKWTQVDEEDFADILEIYWLKQFRITSTIVVKPMSVSKLKQGDMIVGQKRSDLDYILYKVQKVNFDIPLTVDVICMQDGKKTLSALADTFVPLVWSPNA